MFKILKIILKRKGNNNSAVNNKKVEAKEYNFSILCFFWPLASPDFMIEALDKLASTHGVQQLYFNKGVISEELFSDTAPFNDFQGPFKSHGNARKIKKIFIDPNRNYNGLQGFELVKHIYQLSPRKDIIVIMVREENERLYNLAEINTIGDFEYVKFPTSYTDFCNILNIEM